MKHLQNIYLFPARKNVQTNLLYSLQYDSFCMWDGNMYKNDGKVSSADFWGIEKAVNNGFEPYYIYVTKNVGYNHDEWILYKGIGNLGFSKEVRKYDSKDPLADINCEKVILTNHFELINDGVQEISFSLLEYFIKNPIVEQKLTRKYFLNSEIDLYQNNVQSKDISSNEKT
jgi:hypothetical protein